MAALTHKSAHRHGHDLPLWTEHLLEDPRFAYLLAWIVFLLTLAFFAAAPAF